MRRMWWRDCFILLSLTIAFGAVSAGEAAAVSTRGEGGFEFYLDVSSLPSTTGATLALIQIAVPTKEIRYIPAEGKYVAEFRLSIQVKANGRSVFQRVVRKKDTRDVEPRGRDLSTFIYEIDSCFVTPGRYEFTVKVDDLKRRQKTLLGLIRRQHVSSRVKEAAIDIPAYPLDRLALGDPILVWSGTSLRSFVPNPMQLYGLKKDTLTVLVGAVVPESSSADSLSIRITLGKEMGEVVQTDLFKVSVRERQAAFFKLVDLTTYPAGSYRLLVEADDGGTLYAQSGVDFSVAWELLNWQKPIRDILMEARIVLNDDEFASFSAMSLGEQESFMKAFWKRADPTPQTALNERYERFVYRLRYADAHFGGFTRGALSDRGYVYIRFGQPDEIVRQPMPVNRDDLSEAMERVESQYKIIVDGITTERARGVDRRPRAQNPVESRASHGRGDMDTGGYEIWSYNFKGDPLLDIDQSMTVRSGLRFLFVDLDGYGDYRLTGSSEELMKD